MPEKAKPGDEVRTRGQVRTGKVTKVNPDRTRVIKTKLGTLRKEKDPPKPKKFEDDHTVPRGST